ncbi:MAG: tail fiber domain-containing protein [Verrucomicrobiae bacterium]|nr:tail fiber domain-containing protein [Verrucomicrobiae bacterium]
MKIKQLHFLTVLGLIGLTATVSWAQGTAFTYQGRLNSGGTPFNGNAEFQATLWTAATGGTQVAANNPTAVVVGVTNGLFTLPLDFGAQFSGAGRWLQLEVRTSIGAFTTLTPRQTLTPTPYALTAAGLSGSLPAAQLSGAIANANLPASPTFAGTVVASTFSGNGANLTNVNAVTLNGLNSASFWRATGNAGTTPGNQFIGTTDDQPLEFKVNGIRALRLEPGTMIDGAPNVIGGSPRNFVAPGVVGATIAGGGATNYYGLAYTNSVRADFGAIGGGLQNTIQTNADNSTISGGYNNTIQTNAYYSTIGGGYYNTIQTNAYYSTIGGGYYNTIQTNAAYATISGGLYNTIQANVYRSTIGGGWANTIQTNTAAATIGGGYNNTIQPNAYESTIGGGRNNTIQANGFYATIPGGYDNSAVSYAFAAGTRAKANHSGAFVWADAQSGAFSSTAPDEFNIRAQNGVRIQSNKGIHLNAQDAPMIVRDWNPFAANAPGGKAGIGRWGLFMEPTYLTMGIPAEDIPGRTFRVSKYNTNGTATALMTVNQAGAVTAQSFNPSSDRHLKENFEAVSPEEVLAKVAALPISRWNFKGETETVHVGPMAQDFHATFGLGTDDKHIATVDADGVALAAIQGLNRKLETEAAALRTENTELKARLERLERLLLVQTSGGAK